MRKAAVAAATLLSALTLTGCSAHTPAPSANAHASSSAPVVTESSTPTTSSTPATLPTNNDPLPADLQDISGMDPHEVTVQSKSDRFRYLSYVNRNVKQIASEWQAETGRPSDVYPTAPLSIDSSPQNILTSADYNTRLSLLQSVKDAGKRALTCAEFLGAQSGTYLAWSKTIDSLTGYPLTVRDAASLNVDPAATVVNASPVQTTPLGDKYRVIGWTATYTDLAGNDKTITGTGKFYYVEFTDYLNRPATAWIKE